jgi:hypothetical protein
MFELGLAGDLPGEFLFVPSGQLWAMSALPPKADIRNGSDDVRRTSSDSLAMFAAIRRPGRG